MGRAHVADVLGIGALCPLSGAAGRHTAAAGGAVEIPAEQHTTAILARDIAPRGVLRLALFGNLLCGVEQGFVNDLQFGQVR